MSQEDYLRIRVADFEVGLIGLKSAIEEVASSMEKNPMKKFNMNC